MRQLAQFAALFLATALVGSAQQVSGGWELNIRHDPMDDSEKASMLLKAKASTHASLLPTLALRCQSSKVTKEPDVYLITETPLTVENGHHTHALRIRFDDNAPEITVWSDSEDDKAVFHDPLYFDGKWHLDDENPDENPSSASKNDAPNCEQFTHDAYVRCVREKMDALMRAHDEKMAKLNQRFEAERNHADPSKIQAQLAFINRIASAKRLRLEFTPFGGTPIVAEFDPSGAPRLLGKMGEVCGWRCQRALAPRNEFDLCGITIGARCRTIANRCWQLTGVVANRSADTMSPMSRNTLRTALANGRAEDAYPKESVAAAKIRHRLARLQAFSLAGGGPGSTAEELHSRLSRREKLNPCIQAASYCRGQCQ